MLRRGGVMSAHTEQVTADQLLGLPDDGKRRELVAGELREMPPSGHEHGRVTMRLSGPLSVFVEEHDLGAVYAAETGFLLAQNPDTVRGPDVAFVSKERLASVAGRRGYFPGAPDLAVEVISPGDLYSDVEAKVEEWLGAGCRMVVVVNPRNRTLKVYRSLTSVAVLTAADTFEGGEVVPGFRMAVGRLFPG
jgi:Uma2 family endonuclease